MDENLTKREVMLFAREMKKGKMTPVLGLFIPDVYDKGTVVTDVFDPNFMKTDNWADTINKAIENIETALETKVENTVQVVGEDILTGGGALNINKLTIKHKTDPGYKHVPTGGATGQYLKWLKNGEAQWADIDINLDDYYNKTEVDQKFKNFCPFPVNSLYITLGSENPSSLWLGTTWQKQEGRFLLGSSSSYSLGSTGGNSSVALSVDNLAPHTHTATTASHTHTQPAHSHNYGITRHYDGTYYTAGANQTTSGTKQMSVSSAGGETTGSASPVTTIGSTGKGTAFSILPPYLVVNIWKRLS